MSLKQKVLATFVALLVVFAGGVWAGYRIDRGNDPQDNIKTVFTPYEDGIANYLAFLDKAQRSVLIADYSFTDPRIVDKLIELKTGRKQVDIHLLLDLSQTQGRSGEHEQAQIERLRAAGIEVVIGTAEKAHAIMHDKYTVIDGEWVESGSWNYTKSANDQANVQDYIRSKTRAKLFSDNWQRMYRFMKAQESQRSADKASAEDDNEDGDGPVQPAPKAPEHRKSPSRHAPR